MKPNTLKNFAVLLTVISLLIFINTNDIPVLDKVLMTIGVFGLQLTSYIHFTEGENDERT